MTVGLISLPVEVAAPACPARRRRLVTRRLLSALTAAVIVLIAAAAVANDHFARRVGALATHLVHRLAEVPWQLTPVLMVIAVLHYAAAALSLRTVCGLRLPLMQAFKVQLAAAAANRVTPAGLGGAALNSRFLTRHGQDTTQAVASVSTLGVFGIAANALIFVALVLVGSWFGLHGASHELAALAHKTDGPLIGLWHFLSWIGLLAVAAALAAAGVLVKRLHRRRAHSGRPAGLAARLRRDLGIRVGSLARAPKKLLILLSCSAVTTLSLGLGFMLTARFATGGTTIGVGGLVIGYLLGGAAGSVTPGPAGVGATEAALAGILIAGHMPTSTAISAVVFFRVVTFYLPALAGLCLLPRLRRENAI